MYECYSILSVIAVILLVAGLLKIFTNPPAKTNLPKEEYQIANPFSEIAQETIIENKRIEEAKRQRKVEEDNRRDQWRARENRITSNLAPHGVVIKECLTFFGRAITGNTSEQLVSKEGFKLDGYRDWFTLIYILIPNSEEYSFTVRIYVDDENVAGYVIKVSYEHAESTIDGPIWHTNPIASFNVNPTKDDLVEGLKIAYVEMKNYRA